jgi:hypothetical protein
MAVVCGSVTGDIDGGIVDIATGGPEGSSAIIVGDEMGGTSGSSLSTSHHQWISSEYTNLI